MGILSDFEDRISGAIEGMFAGAFRSPVQPVELARALARAADDGRSLGVATVYIPTSYTIALSPEDGDKLGTFRATLAGELATYLADHAREHDYHLHERPKIDFVVHEDLKLGRFRVSASLAEEPTQGVRSAGEREPAPPAEPGMATVTVGDLGHDVVLSGDEVLVGRLAECQIHIADANVSRRHAAFMRLDDGWAIADLGSTNGTRVNGRTIERARLRDGDVIEIGLARLIYHQPRS
ncbi:MAG: FhaA domain-containing protein [Coriobacteriia bacterium]